MTDAEFIAAIKRRLSNAAIPDEELQGYLDDARRDVRTVFYSPQDYIAQVIDTACHYLFTDNKFPEIISVTENGLSTSLGGDGPEKFRRRIDGRRRAAFVAGGPI